MAFFRTKIQNFFHLIKLMLMHSQEAECLQQAAALAYTSLLAIVPFFAVGFVIFAKFPYFQTTFLQLQKFIFSNFVPATGTVILTYLENLVTKAVGLSIISLVFLVVSSIAVLFLLNKIINDIWQTPTRHSWIWVIIIYFTVLVLLPLLFAVGFVITSALSNSIYISDYLDKLGFLKYIFPIIPFVISTFAFSILYYTIPNRHIPIMKAIYGGVAASVLFELAKHLFVYYLNISIYNSLYGAIAIIPTFLIWLYISWLVILWGAVISYVLTTHS